MCNDEGVALGWILAALQAGQQPQGVALGWILAALQAGQLRPHSQPEGLTFRPDNFGRTPSPKG